MKGAGGGSIGVDGANPGRLRPPGGAARGLRRALRAALLLAAACACLLLPSSAFAALAHPREVGLDIAGLNHACGAAVDSNGDVYLSSAGESKVKVYDPTHKLLTSISDTHEPCGLGVATTGVLYVSEKGTGEVVSYKPDKYPFEGTPTYGVAKVVDASGEAKGIAVDPFDNRLYVAEGDRISTYDSSGTLGFDEVQSIFLEATGGTFTLEFEAQKTSPLPFNPTAAEIKSALEELSTIGAGDVSVEKQFESGANRTYAITFEGALASTDVEAIGCDASALTGVTKHCIIAESGKGWSGHIGEGALVEATGVASSSFKPHTNSEPEATREIHLAVADANGLAADRLLLFGGISVEQLNLHRELTGANTPDGSFGYGPAGAYLTADPGNVNLATSKCEAVGTQACTAGHLFLYDAAHAALDEFDASGEFVDRIADPGFADAVPTAVAIDRSGGVDDGTIYVTAGAGSGAKALAFGPLPQPIRTLLPEPLSHVLKTVNSVATDSHGNVYAAAGSLIHIYDPAGSEITSFEDSREPEELAVDSTGHVYVLDERTAAEGHDRVTYYTPTAYPPVPGTTYERREPALATGEGLGEAIRGIAVNSGPSAGKDHLFLTGDTKTQEYASASSGSALLNPAWAKGFTNGSRRGIAVNGANGNVLIAKNPSEHTVYVFNPEGTKILARIDSKVSRTGESGPEARVAVDQRTGHVLAFDTGTKHLREYDASGGFVTEVGGLTEAVERHIQVAVDNSCAVHEPPLDETTTPTCAEFDPSYGNVYVAFDDPNKNHPPYDLNAFGPLSYGEAPAVVTGHASEVGEGGATLNGTVNPGGFPVTQCSFVFIEASRYEENEEEAKPPFEGGEEAACEPEAGALGEGNAPVPVAATVTLPDPEVAYRFALRATNQFGEGVGRAGVFGAPRIEPLPPHPVLYSEATLRADLDPSGLATEYEFEYLDRQSFEEQGGFEGPATLRSGSRQLPAGEAGVPVAFTAVGLAEATEYVYRLVAGNEAGTAVEPTQSLVTQVRRPAEECPNSAYRVGFSANLPDCRAYELVTPAQTNGLTPFAATESQSGPAGIFNYWLTPPRGEAAGERLFYSTNGTLPGFEGQGHLDGYRAERGAGEHPAAGWQTSLVSPRFVEEPFGEPHTHGVAPDGLYSIWEVAAPEGESFPETLTPGLYLRTPSGFEPFARGSSGADLKGLARYVSAGGKHVIFDSRAQLEPSAPPPGVSAIYDRAAGAGSATVISTPPAGATEEVAAEFESKDAGYVGASEDGGSVAFSLGGALYLHRGGETFEITKGSFSFAGISEDGTRIFYSGVVGGATPAGLYVCDTAAGPCAGPGAQPPAEIAAAGIFALVSPDGSHAFFSSEEAIGEEANENGEAPEAGAHNLYAWEGGEPRFIARLTTADFEQQGFGGLGEVNLTQWSHAVGVHSGQNGRAQAPTRSTPGGGVLVFQSHARLTAYDNQGQGEIYRYDPAAPAGQRLLCVSCDPSGAPPTQDALLQDVRRVLSGTATAPIPNLTDSGDRVFFQSEDRLLPEDANEAEDVYEWMATGTGGCSRPSGCLALISSGQGEKPSYLYSMSADGRDVFIRTNDLLVGADLAGPSLYDARVGGGIPEPTQPAPCQGDACQGSGSEPPALPSPATTGAGEGNATLPPPRCPKGKHRVNGRCVPIKHKHKHRRHHRRIHAKQGGSR